MNTTDNVFYQAEKGCFIVRKTDNFIMGEDIYLGSADSIDNYEDQAYTEESYKQFYESLGMEVPAKDEEQEETNGEASEA